MADSTVVQAGKQMASVGVHSDQMSNESIVENILHTLPAEAVASGRNACASARWTYKVDGEDFDKKVAQWTKEDGWPGDMNNGAHCLANLQRQARDGQILQFYRDETRKEGIDPEYMARTFAEAAITYPDVKFGRVKFARPGKEPLSMGMGSNKAFDAGFTVGYLDGVKAENLPHDPAVLPQVTTQCVSGNGTIGDCAVVGYIQGAAAKRTEVASR